MSRLFTGMTIRCTIIHTMPKKSTVKQKRTFSLSPESLEYLESVRKQKKAPSTSTVLDEIIREQKMLAKRRTMGEEITSYYDSLTDEQRAEDAAWGRFAESQFPNE